MGNNSYIIAKDDSSVSDRRALRQGAIDAATNRALAVNGGWAHDTEQLTNPREFERVRDAGSATTQWLTAALAAVGTEYSCFAAVAAPTLAANRVAVFYAVTLVTIPVNISLLRFRLTAATGNMMGEFDTQKLLGAQEMTGYFSTPMIYGPNDAISATVMCVVASLVAENVVLHGFTVEPKGTTII